MSFDTIADELYGLAQQEFVSARNDRARAARGAGDRALAEQIRALGKPTVVAWLANQVVRRHGNLIESLVSLGHELREAMASPYGPELRRLDAHQRELVSTLLQRSREVAGSSGRPATDQVIQGLTDTFRAALADQRAAAALVSGRLTDALALPTFAGVPAAGEPSETPRSTSRRTNSSGGGEAGDSVAARREAARQDVAAAQDHAEELRRLLKQARASLDRSSRRTRLASELVEQLRSELAEATAQRDGAQQEEEAARSAHDRADFELREAEERLRDSLDVLEQA